MKTLASPHPITTQSSVLASGRQETRGAETAQRPQPQILVVDDDPSVREMLARTLAGDGYRVLSVPEGTEVVEALPEARIELVLLDENAGGAALPHFKILRLGSCGIASSATGGVR